MRFLAHTLKGTAGNLGLKRVRELAGVLDLAIRQEAAGDAVDPICTALIQAWSSVAEAIAEL
jgi:HPt (histidine-containing phosphotransfer) domain-containing protein